MKALEWVCPPLSQGVRVLLNPSKDGHIGKWVWPLFFSGYKDAKSPPIDYMPPRSIRALAQDLNETVKPIFEAYSKEEHIEDFHQAQELLLHIQKSSLETSMKDRMAL